MYAICFDMVVSELEKHYGTPYNKAYDEIKKTLKTFGFQWQQGSTYFGVKDDINAVTCVVAVQELTRKYIWFAPSVRDIRMLRVEEDNDLMPAIKMVYQQK